MISITSPNAAGTYPFHCTPHLALGSRLRFLVSGLPTCRQPRRARGRHSPVRRRRRRHGTLRRPTRNRVPFLSGRF